MKTLEDWLLKDERRTAVVCRAKFEGVMKWCCILRCFAKWDLPPKDWPLDAGPGKGVQQVAKVFYADALDAAIEGAMSQ